jgi:general secretion pathway protein D
MRLFRGLLIATLLVGAAAWGQQPGDKVTLNFAGADLESVIRAMGEITGRTMLVDPRVKGTINVVTPGPVTRAQAYEIFLASLRLLGFAAVEAQGVTTILPEVDARLHAIPVAPSGETRPSRGDRLVTQIFILKHEPAALMVPILRPLIAPNNTIAALPGNNSLVITDYAENIRRLARIIEALDTPSGADWSIVPIKYASSLDVAQTVNRLLAGDAGAAPGADTSMRVTILADPRTNSVLLRGDNPARLARARALLEVLDRPTSVPGNMRVVFLKNAEAARVAETLRAIVAGAASATVAAAGPTGASTPPSSIQADPATNSLIITASDVVYNSLRTVIEQLDGRRAQVFVEALIVEVSADKAAEFGIQWNAINNNISTTNARATPFGTSNFGGAGQNILQIAQNPTTVGQGLSVGIVKGQISIGGAVITNLGLLARALETHAKANVLSTPTLLTMDNEEARIVIGQNVPFITGQYAQTGTTATATTPTPFQTIERRDVGLTLRVRPQISEGGAIKMRIFQEVSSVQDRTNVSGIITNKRAIESTVVVDDGLIVVIGGLIEDRVENVIDKVPLLGDLPLLGQLFEYETRRQVKTNLMVFLRPVIVRQAGGSEAITLDRYEYMLDQQRNSIPATQPILPDMRPVELPPIWSSRDAAPGAPAVTPGSKPDAAPQPGDPARAPAR